MMKKLLLLIFTVTFLQANATKRYVTSTKDTGDGSLRNIVATAIPGDSIYFVDLPSNSIIRLLDAIDIDKSISFFGPIKNDLTIRTKDGYGNVFNTNQLQSPIEVYFEHLAFDSVSSTIYAYTKNMTLKVRDCRFTNHGHIALAAADTLMVVDVANCYFSNCYNGVRSQGKTTIKNCIFEDFPYQPLYFTYGPILVEDCVFRRIKQSFSSVQVQKGNANFNRCEFSDNKSSAFYSFKSNIKFNNCEFIRNNGSAEGTVNLSSCDSTWISNCVFKDNVGIAGAGINGGNLKYLSIDKTIFDNNVVPTDGGAIYCYDCVVEINHSTFSNSSARSGGGAVRVNNSLKVANSTFDHNTSLFFAGGAVFVNGNSSFLNSTFSNNSAPEGGAIYISSDTTELINCTVVLNHSNKNGGGIGQYDSQDNGARLKIANTIIALNMDSTTVAQDVSGKVISLGNNFIGIQNGSSGFVTSDLKGTIAAGLDPKIGPLEDHGGFTQTHALLSESAAIDAGNLSLSPASDQRGYLRNNKPDVGAFEFSGITGQKNSSIETSMVRLMPNPSQGICYLEGIQEGLYNLEWFTLIGNKVLEHNYRKHTTMDLDLVPGFYHVKITLPDGNVMFDKILFTK